MIGSSQSSRMGWPSSSTVPRTASVGPTPARIFEVSSLSDTRRVAVSGPSSAGAGRASWSTGRLASSPVGGTDDELQHLARRLRVGRREVRPRRPAPERLVRPLVDQEELGAFGQPGEVDEHVGALGRRQQQLAQGHRGGQEAPVGADLVEGQRRRDGPRGARVGRELEDQEARVAAVEEPEAVAARLDRQHRPGAAVDDHRVAEDLRVPDRRDVALGDVGAGEAVEDGATRRIAERAVRGEGAVLDRERDLVGARPRRHRRGRARVRAGRRRAGRPRRPAGGRTRPDRRRR